MRDSIEMLRREARIAERGWRATHVDVTVIAELPRIAPYRDAMREALGAAFNLGARVVSVKGKTNEGMGWIGRGEGIACIAVATVVPGPRRDRAVATRSSRDFLLERFDDFLAVEQGAAGTTSEAYQRDLARFATYARVKGAARPDGASPRPCCATYMYHLKDLGSRAHVHPPQRLGHAHVLSRFSLGEGEIAKDPDASGSKRPSAGSRCPTSSPSPEVERLLAAPTLDEPLAFRDRALLELAYGAGLRVSEWITLGVKDVLLDEGLVRVFGKGSKERLVPIGRRAIARRGRLSARAQAESRARRRQGRALSQRARSAALAHGRMEDSSQVRRRSPKHRQARHAAHAPALVRHAFARGRSRSAGGPGNARTCQHRHDADLHARRPRISSFGSQAVSSPELTSSLPARRTLSRSGRMLLVIDNYDSFTYNLVQYLGELGADPVVRRNDAITVEEIGAMHPSAIVLSPGPCTPREAGITVPVVKRWGSEIPMLGVCLGHQAIGEAYGGVVDSRGSRDARQDVAHHARRHGTLRRASRLRSR